jgi:NTP pyrophosphatase (non-canonical NTP hydrolase)
LNLSEYQAAAVKTAIYREKITYPTLGLSAEVGELAEKVIDVECPTTQQDVLKLSSHTGLVSNQVKKILRDDNGILSPGRKAAIASEIGDICWYIAALAHDIGVDLGDVAQENLNKLASRQERGTISGDGDNR